MSKTGKRHLRVLTGRRPTRKLRLKVKGGQSTVTSKRKSAATPITIVSTFLHMLNTVKLYHWNTTSYATHKATDQLYESLNSKLDEFVEVMLGKDELGGRAALLNVTTLNLDVNSDIKTQVESYKAYLLAMSNDTKLSALINTDLLAIRDEILALFNQFLYLLSLN
jgi:DNA-binding ferritin-like protein